MKKKLLALTLAFVLLVSLLAACGGNGGNGATPTPAEPEATPAPEVGNPMRGVWDGDVFTSQYLGFRFEMPEGWLAATDEEIAELLGLGADMIAQGTDLGDIMEVMDLTTVTDIMVSDPITGANLSIAFERLVFPHNRLSAQEYMEIASDLLLTMGMEVNFDFPGTTRIGAYDWYSYQSIMDIGINIYGRYFVNVEGGFARVISIIYSEGQEDLVDELLGRFSSL